ncbi:histidine kinase [Halobacterium sp. DL1]|jgi:signal transduction histidine kinase|nr:histidine kinase [Halobacterium sp. DL1]
MSIPSARADSRAPARILGTSVVLGLLIVADAVVRLLGSPEESAVFLAFDSAFLVGVATMVPFLVGIAYAGYWLAGSDLDPQRFGRIWRWTVVGAVVSAVLNLALMTVLPVDSALMGFAWLRWAVAVGAGVGVLIGVVEARAIQAATDAERTEVHAEHLEAQRDLLDYLNSLLRHEVLNASNVISGYASLLKDDHDQETPVYEHSDTIHRRSEEITRVIEDVRVLLLATDGEATAEPVDLTETLVEEVAKLQDLDETVVVETSMPESVHVWADPLLLRVFGNLLANAVEHNDSSPPRVSVSVDAADDRVTVDITDNGRGIPEEEVETLFDRPSQRTADHGFGTHLAAKLVEQYGGSIELVETGAAGSTFRVTLPRATASSEPGQSPADPTSSFGTSVD